MASWIDWVDSKSRLLPGNRLTVPQPELPGFDLGSYAKQSVPFGLAGRLIKEKQSVAIGMDLYDPQSRRNLLYFLHALHIDA